MNQILPVLLGCYRILCGIAVTSMSACLVQDYILRSGFSWFVPLPDRGEEPLFELRLVTIVCHCNISLDYVCILPNYTQVLQLNYIRSNLLVITIILIALITTLVVGIKYLKIGLQVIFYHKNFFRTYDHHGETISN